MGFTECLLTRGRLAFPEIFQLFAIRGAFVGRVATANSPAFFRAGCADAKVATGMPRHLDVDSNESIP